MDILFAKGAYRRQNGQLPELRLVNMWAEATPAAEGGVAIVHRPGLEELSDVGDGPVSGLFTQPGTFNGDLFRVSGSYLYRDDRVLGDIDGSGPPIFAASADEVLVTRGKSLWSYKANGLRRVAFPDGAEVRAVAFVNGQFVAVRSGTHKFYWSGVLDGRSWDALDFASAESEPDELLDVVSVRGNIFLLGQATVEPWEYTGELNLPFQLFQNSIYLKGTLKTGCAQVLDNAMLWVGSDGIVYRQGEVPQRLSDHGIEERIGSSTTCVTYPLVYQGHSFFCVRLDDNTFAFDVATGEWCEFASYGRNNFRALCGASSGTSVYIGDRASGKVFGFNPDLILDDGDETVEARFTFALPIGSGALTVDNLNFEMSVGTTALLAGQGSDPVAEIRTSRDAGKTFGVWRSVSLGRQGEYRTRVQLRRVGMFDPPGFLGEMRMTHPQPRRISRVSINEAGGGRSR